MPLAPQIAQNLDATLPWLPVACEPGGIDSYATVVSATETVAPIPRRSGRLQNVRPKRLADAPLRLWKLATIEHERIVCVDDKNVEIVCKPEDVADVEDELFEEELDAATKTDE